MDQKCDFVDFFSPSRGLFSFCRMKFGPTDVPFWGICGTTHFYGIRLTKAENRKTETQRKGRAFVFSMKASFAMYHIFPEMWYMTTWWGSSYLLIAFTMLIGSLRAQHDLHHDGDEIAAGYAVSETNQDLRVWGADPIKMPAADIYGCQGETCSCDFANIRFQRIHRILAGFPLVLHPLIRLPAPVMCMAGKC